MTAATTTPPAVATRRAGLADGLNDALVVARRFVLQLLRTPQLIVFTIVQSVLFLFVFRYVFGGSIKIPGLAYVDYLIPAFLTQVAIFDGFAVAVGLATDAKSGLIQRFRSLPMARAAFVTGRAMADILRQLAVMVILTMVGYLIGFQFHSNVARIVAAFGVALAFGFALFWLFAWIGLLVKDSESAQAAGTPLMILAFLSTAYVQVGTLPSGLEQFARYQPVSQVTNALRGLMEGRAAEALVEHSTGYYVASSLIWCIVITAVFAPLAVRAYRKL